MYYSFLFVSPNPEKNKSSDPQPTQPQTNQSNDLYPNDLEYPILGTYVSNSISRWSCTLYSSLLVVYTHYLVHVR